MSQTNYTIAVQCRPCELPGVVLADEGEQIGQGDPGAGDAGALASLFENLASVLRVAGPAQRDEMLARWRDDA